jgi:hypothetical protein
MKGLGGVLLTLTLALACAGCGEVKPGDLFILTRTDPATHSHLTLLINEEGGVQCNGGRMLKLSDPALVQARAIQEELHEDELASRNTVLPSRPGSVLNYYLRDENGSVRFADNSAPQPKVFRNLALFVLQTAQQLCHLPI